MTRRVASSSRMTGYLAVVVRLSDGYEDLAGYWFLEVGFGDIDGVEHPTFPDLRAAQDWLATKLRRAL